MRRSFGSQGQPEAIDFMNSPRTARVLFVLLGALTLLLTASAVLRAVAPSWWQSKHVYRLDAQGSVAEASDFQAANRGQLKNMAVAAYEHFVEHLEPAGGPVLGGLGSMDGPPEENEPEGPDNRAGTGWRLMHLVSQWVEVDPATKKVLRRVMNGNVPLHPPEHADAWSPTGTGPRKRAESATPREDFAAINQGQLKATALPFYDRLIELYRKPDGTYFPEGAYPKAWTDYADETQHYSVANIGQMKRVFSFDLEADADGDELTDLEELKWNAANSPLGSALPLNPRKGDSDGDGLTDAEEIALGTNPGVADTDGDGKDDGVDPNPLDSRIRANIPLKNYAAISLNGPLLSGAGELTHISLDDTCKAGLLFKLADPSEGPSNSEFRYRSFSWSAGQITQKYTLYDPPDLATAKNDPTFFRDYTITGVASDGLFAGWLEHRYPLEEWWIRGFVNGASYKEIPVPDEKIKHGPAKHDNRYRENTTVSPPLLETLDIALRITHVSPAGRFAGYYSTVPPEAPDGGYLWPIERGIHIGDITESFANPVPAFFEEDWEVVNAVSDGFSVTAREPNNSEYNQLVIGRPIAAYGELDPPSSGGSQLKAHAVAVNNKHQVIGTYTVFSGAMPSGHSGAFYFSDGQSCDLLALLDVPAAVQGEGTDDYEKFRDQIRNIQPKAISNAALPAAPGVPSFGGISHDIGLPHYITFTADLAIPDPGNPANNSIWAPSQPFLLELDRGDGNPQNWRYRLYQPKMNDGSIGTWPGNVNKFGAVAAITSQGPKLAFPFEIMEVISNQIDGNECNKLPTAYYDGEPNNPMLMAGQVGIVASINVRAQVASNLGEICRVGIRRFDPQNPAHTFPILRSTLLNPYPDASELRFPAEDGHETYELVAGLDVNGNSELDSPEAIIKFEKTPRTDKNGKRATKHLNYIDKLIVVTRNDALEARGTLDEAAFIGQFGAEFAHRFLYTFVYGAANTPGPNVDLNAKIRATTPGLTHKVGAKWDNNNDEDTTRRYLFGNDSDVMAHLRSSNALRTCVSSAIRKKLEELMDPALTPNTVLNGGVPAFRSEEIPYEESFPLLETEKDRPGFNELGLGFGKVTLKGTVNITYTRVLPPNHIQERLPRRIVVIDQRVTCSFDDVYDFAIGTNGYPADVLAKAGARLQAGYATYSEGICNLLNDSRPDPSFPWHYSNLGQVYFTRTQVDTGVVTFPVDNRPEYRAFP